MTTSFTVILRFADGGVGYLQNSDVTTGTAGEEIKTSNASSALNQVADVPAGQAFNGRVVTHAIGFASTQNAYTASYLWCAIKDAQGRIVVPIQGGGGKVAELPRLYKPTALSTGMSVHGAWQAAADSASLFGSLSVCSPRKCDIFFAQGSDTASVELVNANGASVGQSMAGSTATMMWGVYPSTIGMNNQGGGVSALWVTDAQGQAKALIPPSDGGGASNAISSSDTQAIRIPVRFSQNDQGWINTDT